MTSRDFFRRWVDRQSFLHEAWAGREELKRRTGLFLDRWLEGRLEVVSQTSGHGAEAEELRHWREGRGDSGEYLFPIDTRLREFLSEIEQGAFLTGIREPPMRSRESSAARALIADLWAADLEKRRALAEKRGLAEGLPALKETLTGRVLKLRQTEDRMESIFGKRDWGWDLERGPWEDADLSNLLDYARRLEKETEIRRIAELLGRDYRAKTRKPESPPPVTPPRLAVPEVGKLEICGISQGAELSDALVTELGLLAFRESETVFLKKWAEGELLTHLYRAPAPPPSYRKTLDHTPQKRNERGPLILVLDTSGSMRGLPEEKAKLAVLAVVRIALQEDRPCFLINFSSDIRVLEVSDLGKNLADFLRFLAFSFHGGTDLTPALRKALEVLESRRYKEADVLVLSDFAVPKIPEVLRRAIRRRQNGEDSRFYSLTVSARPLKDFLNIFDAGWVYNIHHDQKHGIAPDSIQPIW